MIGSKIPADCHFEHLMTELPLLADMEVAKVNTLANFLGNLAQYIQRTITPLTTGGSSVHCNLDYKSVHTKLRKLEAYLEQGYKETLDRISSNDPLKETMEEVVGGSFGKIVTEVERLKQKFQNGETKKCFIRPFGKKIKLLNQKVD